MDYITLPESFHLYEEKRPIVTIVIRELSDGALVSLLFCQAART